jgi:hypothetical protein
LNILKGMNKQQIGESGIFQDDSAETIYAFEALAGAPCPTFAPGMMTNLILLVISLLSLAPALEAQDFSLDWYKVAGGGGTSAAGAYSLSGTLGQPEAGILKGGSYSMAGGFWSLIAVIRTPGAPVLSIIGTATNTVRVSWPSASAGFALQQSTSVAGASWAPVPQTPSDDGTTKTVSLKQLGGSLYLRLQK